MNSVQPSDNSEQPPYNQTQNYEQHDNQSEQFNNQSEILSDFEQDEVLFEWIQEAYSAFDYPYEELDHINIERQTIDKLTGHIASEIHALRQKLPSNQIRGIISKHSGMLSPLDFKTLVRYGEQFANHLIKYYESTWMS